jgi:AraC-like DNA-binding protein/mannose-6-phosphate isomerase-like protein (cupin superfamily)
MKSFFENYSRNEVTNTRRVIHTPSDIARNTFFYVQEAGYLKSLKPHPSSRSGLDSFLFIYVLSGRGTFTYEGITYNLAQQDCILIDCQQRYTHISSENAPWELLWIHFNGPGARGYYDYIVQKKGHLIHLPESRRISESIEELISIHENRTDDTDIRASAIIVNILTMCASRNLDSPDESALSYKLALVFKYIDEHFSEKITLDQLAKDFSISKFYLTREFKKEYGVTIVQYLLSKKITHAKTLLRYTELPIEEIAVQCGIGDASYFNKVFRKLEGMTASQYRKLW